jgi:hypothetical protein
MYLAPDGTEKNIVSQFNKTTFKQLFDDYNIE